jgi:hypothetical protein
MWTNSAERMRITSDGYVGIGITPTTPLHLKAGPTNNWIATFDNSTTSGHKMYFGYNNDAGVTYGLYITGGRGYANEYDFTVTNKFFVMGDGKVGIGGLPAGGLLDIIGHNPTLTLYANDSGDGNINSVTLAHKINYNNLVATSGSAIVMERESTVNGNYGTCLKLNTRQHGYAQSTKVTVTGAGLVGVGGTPSEKFHVIAGASRLDDGYYLNWGATTTGIVGYGMPATKCIVTITDNIIGTYESKGNVGIGQAPSAWNATYRAIEFAQSNIMGNTVNHDIYLNSNIFFGTTGTWKTKVAGMGASFRVYNGQFDFQTSATATAGADVTVTSKAVITNDGRLGVGRTPTTSYVLDVAAPAAFAMLAATTTTNDSYWTIKNNGNGFIIGKVGSTAGHVISGSTAYSSVIREADGNPIYFGSGNSIGMTLNASNFLGLGTTSPDRRLHSETLDTSTNTVDYGIRVAHTCVNPTIPVPGSFGTGIEFEVTQYNAGVWSSNVGTMAYTTAGFALSHRLTVPYITITGTGSVGFSDAYVSTPSAGNLKIDLTNTFTVSTWAGADRLAISTTGASFAGSVGLGGASPILTTNYGGLTIGGVTGGRVDFKTGNLNLPAIAGNAFIQSTSNTLQVQCVTGTEFGVYLNSAKKLSVATTGVVTVAAGMAVAGETTHTGNLKFNYAAGGALTLPEDRPTGLIAQVGMMYWDDSNRILWVYTSASGWTELVMP